MSLSLSKSIQRAIIRSASHSLYINTHTYARTHIGVSVCVSVCKSACVYYLKFAYSLRKNVQERGKTDSRHTQCGHANLYCEISRLHHLTDH